MDRERRRGEQRGRGAHVGGERAWEKSFRRVEGRKVERRGGRIFLLVCESGAVLDLR